MIRVALCRDARSVRPYKGYSVRCIKGDGIRALTGTDAQIVRPYTGYTSDPSDSSDALRLLRPHTSEEFPNRSRANENSPPRDEIKVRKNEIKLRKNEMKVRKNFSFPHWIIPNIYGRLLHKGESLCCFRDSASVTYGGVLPSDLTLSALRFILSAKSGARLS